MYYNCIKTDVRRLNLLLYANAETNQGEVVDEKHCSAIDKPPSTEVCYGPCDTIRWEYSEWSEVINYIGI